MRGGGAFTEYSVESLSLPETIKAIDDEALKDVPSLKHVQISPKCEGFVSFDDMIFSKDYSHILLIPEGKEGAIAIPGSTTYVPAQALSLCHSGSSLTTGDGGTAFASHDRMLFTKDLKTLVACPSAYGTAVVLPTETETVGEYALAGCKELASITVLGNINSIDPTAFADEVKASAVVALPVGNDYEVRKSVWENVGFQHFAEPAQPGVTTSPDNNEAGGFTYILLDDYTLAVTWQGKDEPQTELEIPSSAEINGVPYRVSTIAENAFANRGSLTRVKLPATTTSIYNGAFAGCANLSAIELPNTLRTIGERAFEATSLKDIWLPASINSIGSRAFASCSTLERVVALGTPEVASDALAGCTNVSIYVPSHSEDTWNPGIPSDNNHLLPYSVSLSEEPLAIEAGQEANLLEGGNLQAPDPIETSYSYAAVPLSVDSGRVSAKKAGTTDVTAVLSLDNVELTRATRTVEVSPNPEGEADIAILNSEVPLPAAYLANARETQLNVTASVDGVIFGKDDPYDVAAANPPASMESTVDFENNMDVPVYLAQVDCTQENVSTVLVGNTGATLATNQMLFSLYPAVKGGEEEAMHFGCDKDIKTASPNNPSAFTIQPKSKSSFVFRLNLTNDLELANAKVNSSVATKNTETKKLASLMYTFETAPLLGFGSGKVESSPFYLKDKTTGEVYTAAQVKEHANAIAKGNTDIKAAYQNFMTKEDTYECKTVWGSTSYDVRIIGINHDDKADTDSPSKAGLTFQFKECLEAHDKDDYNYNKGYRFNVDDSNEGGWGASELRARMNPGVDTTLKHGKDDNAIWNLVPTDLTKVITPVNKRYAPSNEPTTTTTTSRDNLFIASYSEFVPSSYWASSYPWTADEGLRYEYWKEKVTKNSGEIAALVKHNVSPSGSVVAWWWRTMGPYDSRGFLGVYGNGDPRGGNYADDSYGVCPCFCL